MSEVAELTFEDALAELSQLAKQLEQGEIPLAESLTLYARAKALDAHLEALLTPLKALA